MYVVNLFQVKKVLGEPVLPEKGVVQISEIFYIKITGILQVKLLY